MASADERFVGAAAAAMASTIPSDLGVNRFLLRLFAQKKSMSEKDSDPIPGAPSRSPRSRSRSTTVEGGRPFRKNAKPVKNCRYPVADHAPPRSEILIAPTIPHPIRSYRSLAMLTDETRAPPE